jgi:hypothetical protein
MHMTTHKNNFTPVLHSMNHKSIISSISFFLLSIFYVASASGSVTINVDIPKECGAWKQIENNACRGQSSGKAGHNAKFVCAGGGNGGQRGSLTIKFKTCKTVKLQVIHNKRGISGKNVSNNVKVLKGDAGCRQSEGSIYCRITVGNNRLKDIKPTVSDIVSPIRPRPVVHDDYM